MKSIFTSCLTCLLLPLFGLLLLFSSLCDAVTAKSKSTVIRDFEANQDSFQIIADFIQNYDLDEYTRRDVIRTVHCGFLDAKGALLMIINTQESSPDLEVTAKPVVQALDILYHTCGYQTIVGSAYDANCIVFSMNSDNTKADESQGMVYTMDGGLPAEKAFNTQRVLPDVLVPICDHWYYWWGKTWE